MQPLSSRGLNAFAEDLREQLPEEYEKEVFEVHYVDDTIEDENARIVLPNVTSEDREEEVFEVHRKQRIVQLKRREKRLFLRQR